MLFEFERGVRKRLVRKLYGSGRAKVVVVDLSMEESDGEGVEESSGVQVIAEPVNLEDSEPVLEVEHNGRYRSPESLPIWGTKAFNAKVTRNIFSVSGAASAQVIDLSADVDFSDLLDVELVGFSGLTVNGDDG